MSVKVRKIDTSTLAGLKKAERLQARGWKPVAITYITNIVTMQKVA
jgi:hypothetical protein